MKRLTPIVLIAPYKLEQSKDAVAMPIVLARVWTPCGDLNLQQELTDFDNKFNAATSKCSHEGNDQREKFGSLKEASAACSDLHTIHLAASKQHFSSKDEWT